MSVRGRRVGAVGMALWLMALQPAWAHGSAKGLGAFWNGALHPLVEPVQLLSLLALGLWLAMHSLSPDLERRTLVAGAFGFGVAAACAAVSGQDLIVADSGLPERLLQILGLLMALGTVANQAIGPGMRKPWLAWIPAVCACVLAAAALASPAGQLRGLSALGWTAGVSMGVTLLVCYTVWAARWLRGRFRAGHLVPRVLASWVAASLLLVAVLPWVAVRSPAGAAAPTGAERVQPR